MALFKSQNRSVCSLVGDISKAHRRFLHAPCERGLLACKVEEDDNFIYVNKIGTFGVACIILVVKDFWSWCEVDT